MLLLVAPNERKVSIATGYGAGGYMTDAMSGLIIRASHPAALQAEPARLRRRDRSRRGRHHQADEPVRRSRPQKNVAAAEQAQQAARSIGGPGIIPVFFWIMIFGIRDALDVPASSAAGATAAAPAAASARGWSSGASMSSSRGSRQLAGAAAAVPGAVEAAAGAAAAAAASAASAAGRSAAAAHPGSW